MLEIDVDSLLATLTDLKNDYNSLVNSQANLFNNLSNIVTIDWKDGNSVVFDKQIYSEKLETDKFMINVSDKISVVEYIYNNYSGLAKKIKINLDGKSSVLSSIDSCISTLSSICTEFNLIDTSFYYPEAYTIREKRNLCSNLKNSLSSIRNDVDALYQKIEKIEAEVLKKINELENFVVASFGNISKGSIESVEGGRLLYSQFVVDKQKVEFYIKEEATSYANLHKNAKRLSSDYKSSNTGKYLTTYTNYKNSYETIYGKRKHYIAILDPVPLRYKQVAEKTKDIFRGKVKNG